MMHQKITVLSISDPTGTTAPSAGANGELGRLALLTDIAGIVNISGSQAAQNAQITTISGDIIVLQSQVNSISANYATTASVSAGLNTITQLVNITGNFVTLDTSQNISGNKTFTGAISATSNSYFGAAPAIINSGITSVDVVTNQIVEQFADTIGSGAKWLMNVKNGANIRTSEIMCAWDSGTNAVIANEVSTTEVGTTTDVSYNVVISSNSVQLRVTSVSNGWTLKFYRIAL